MFTVCNCLLKLLACSAATWILNISTFMFENHLIFEHKWPIITNIFFLSILPFIKMKSGWKQKFEHIVCNVLLFDVWHMPITVVQRFRISGIFRMFFVVCCKDDCLYREHLYIENFCVGMIIKNRTSVRMDNFVGNHCIHDILFLVKCLSQKRKLSQESSCYFIVILEALIITLFLRSMCMWLAVEKATERIHNVCVIWMSMRNLFKVEFNKNAVKFVCYEMICKQIEEISC